MTPLPPPKTPPNPPGVALSEKATVKAVRTVCQAGVFALQVSDSELRSSDMKGLIDRYFNT